MENLWVVSVVNDKDVYNKYIENNVYYENKNIHKKWFDNTEKSEYISVLYNRFLDSYNYKNPGWILFCHQDWEVLEDVYTRLCELDKDKIYGPVGAYIRKPDCKDNLGRERGYCWEGMVNGERRYIAGTVKEDGYIVTDTVDAQALFVHSNLVKKYNLRFDENLTFHLYAEDFSINAKLKHSIYTFIFHIDSCHHSDSAVKFCSGYPQEYYRMRDYVNSKYPNDLFESTCGAIGGGSYSQYFNNDIS